MRISRRKRPQKAIIPHYKKNEHIEAPKLLVLDENGGNLGIMSKSDALKLAEERELDLVEINPKSDPPVVKIVEFADFKYQKEKEARKQRAHSRASETKGIRLSMRIGGHDMEVKKGQAEKFLERGDKVKLELIMKGRENARPDIGEEVIKKFVELLGSSMQVRVEQETTRQGRKMTAIVARQ